MPRKARSDMEKQEDRIRAVIRTQQQLYHFQQKDMSEILMISSRLYTTKFSCPLHPRKGFRLGDIVAMNSVLHFTPEQKAAFVP